MPSRRSLLILSALGAAGAVGGALWWRGKAEKPEPPGPRPAFRPDRFDPGRKVTLGFIYVGAPDDFGYNQSHAKAAAELATLPWIDIVAATNVPEDGTVTAVMEDMIENQGAEFLFPTSYGYFDPYMLEIAPRYPEVHFLHTGGLALPGHPPNVSSIYGYIDEAMYICGLVAAHTTGADLHGFIGAMPIPVVLRNLNAFALGARTVNPGLQVQARFTGAWHDPEAEAAACRALIDAGAQAIACHVDSPPTIMQTCEAAGIAALGYHVDQSEHAPTRLLTGAEWNWGGLYLEYVMRHLQKRDWPSMMRGGLRDAMVGITPLSAIVPPEARQAAEDVLERARQEKFHIYSGPILDNNNEILIPEGTLRHQDDPWLETMDWFVQGVDVVTG